MSSQLLLSQKLGAFEIFRNSDPWETWKSDLTVPDGMHGMQRDCDDQIECAVLDLRQGHYCTYDASEFTPDIIPNFCEEILVREADPSPGW